MPPHSARDPRSLAAAEMSVILDGLRAPARSSAHPLGIVAPVGEEDLVVVGAIVAVELRGERLRGSAVRAGQAVAGTPIATDAPIAPARPPEIDVA